MSVDQEIADYIAAQPERKRSDMQALHGIILGLMPGCRLWFLDGKDKSGRTISNPNIGYGLQTKKYADGRAKAFYQIGVSANTTGISVYIMGSRGQEVPGRHIRQGTRQSERDGVLHQVQDTEQHQHRCSRSGDSRWD